MNLKNYCDAESARSNKPANIQFPNRFKKIGIAIAIFSFSMLIINKFKFESEQVRFVSKHGLLIGFLFISLAKEIIEDEFIKNLRMQSYAFAFVVCVAYSVFMPYLEYFVDALRGKTTVLQDSGDFMVLWVLLIVQVSYFSYLKRLFK